MQVLTLGSLLGWPVPRWLVQYDSMTYPYILFVYRYIPLTSRLSIAVSNGHVTLWCHIFGTTTTCWQHVISKLTRLPMGAWFISISTRNQTVDQLVDPVRIRDPKRPRKFSHTINDDSDFLYLRLEILLFFFVSISQISGKYILLVNLPGLLYLP